MKLIARMNLSAVGLAVAAAFGMAAPAHADTFGFNGYFRAGAGTTSTSSNGGNSRQCYNLPGVDAGHYRLGNECNLYGEFGFNDYGTANGVKYHNMVMINEYNAGTDIGGSKASFEQMYSEISGVDFAPNVHFWAGQRFYGRANIDMLDHFFVRMDGVGGGADNIGLGPGKLGLAYFGSDNYSPGVQGSGVATNIASGRRFNFDYTGLPVNPGGTLRITGTLTKSNAVGGTTGEAISFQHNQDIPALGAGNVLWLQLARGSASLAQNFGAPTTSTSASAWRLADALNWQVGNFSGQADLVYGHHDAGTANNSFAPTATYTNGVLANSVAYKNSSIGARFAYALTNNLRVIGQLGHMIKTPDGQPTEKLTIATIGLGIVPDAKVYYSRPEIRLYFTHASWNAAAANDPANSGYNGDNGLPGYQVNGASTSGNSVGVQVETWF